MLKKSLFTLIFGIFTQINVLFFLSLSANIPNYALAQGIPPAGSPGGASSPGNPIGGGGSNKMPWEQPLCDLKNSLVGPTAKAIALIGLFVAGGLLVFGGELSDFGRRITWMCLAISVMLAANSFLDLFGTTTNC